MLDHSSFKATWVPADRKQQRRAEALCPSKVRRHAPSARDHSRTVLSPLAVASAWALSRRHWRYSAHRDLVADIGCRIPARLTQDHGATQHCSAPGRLARRRRATHRACDPAASAPQPVMAASTPVEFTSCTGMCMRADMSKALFSEGNEFVSMKSKQSCTFDSSLIGQSHYFYRVETFTHLCIYFHAYDIYACRTISNVHSAGTPATGNCKCAAWASPWQCDPGRPSQRERHWATPRLR
jgi:hypothetical protein